ncbi:MAG: hypothetical protein KAQ79_20915, partial [Cyclobacteriaceae bacterium]|nr:hypothetical protein [Cyclobacteriaceae bacterium]
MIATIHRYNNSITFIYADNSSIVLVLLKTFNGRIFEYANHILQFDYPGRCKVLSSKVSTNLNILDY